MKDNAGLDIFISVLLRYPEFNAVKYDAANEKILIEIALQGEIEPDSKESFIKEVQECIKLLHRLSNTETSVVNISFEEYRKSHLTFIKYKRDVENLTEAEIEIFAGILQKRFNQLIIKDSGVKITADHLKKQVKENLLYKIHRGKTNSSKFLAYRDDGRVLVFNK